MGRLIDRDDLEAALRTGGVTDAAASRIRTALSTRAETRHDSAPSPSAHTPFQYAYSFASALPALGLLILMVGLSIASAAFLFEFGGLPVIAVAFWLSF
ncbi:MAG: hypothetical protein AAGH57_00870 [Pseudomonadota bacterium]